MTGSLLFNPSQASTEELESTFVGRQAILDHIENDLLDDLRIGTSRHWQIIGPRGSGKSHLTELLARRMRIRHGWRVARLPEENYQVASLGEFLEKIYIRAEQLASSSPLSDTTDEIQLQDRALDRLRSAQSLEHPLLVIIENLVSIFDRQLRSTRDQARLRDILTNNPPFILVATSTSQSGATTKHAAPLYNFFQNVVLEDLSQSDTTELVRARADWEGNTSLLADFSRVKGRVEAIYHLSGGNPRLALALYRVVQHGVTSELHDQLMKLLDEVTPYYQARLNDIPPQAARVLTEMAISEMVITPSEIARRCRLATNQVTAQITKLIEERLVVHGGKPDRRSRLYELKDRLLRVWLQMRESAGAAKRLRFLAEFFERWYANRKDELEAFSKRTVADFWRDVADGDERRCDDRLKTLSYLADVHQSFGGSPVLWAISAKVNESSEADIRNHIKGIKKAFDRSNDLREREALAILLAECFVALDAEADAGTYLKSVIEDGSQDAAIAARYVSAQNEAGDFAAALTFGERWLAGHPSHDSVHGPLGIAAFGVGQFEKGFLLLRGYVVPMLCQHCAETVLARALRVLRARGASKELEFRFFVQFIGPESPPDVTEKQMEAVHAILLDSKASEIPVEVFEAASEAWKPLSKGPLWLFQKAICGLSHRSSCESQALQYIAAFSGRIRRQLSDFAVDHLVEILPSLRRSRIAGASGERDYAVAMSLIRERVSKRSLSKAFRFNAPRLAKKSRPMAKELLEIYREWRQEGLLEENITPYSEALAVLSSKEPSRSLESLHPENRDAVNLLLNAVRKNENAVPGDPAQLDAPLTSGVSTCEPSGGEQVTVIDTRQ